MKRLLPGREVRPWRPWTSAERIAVALAIKNDREKGFSGNAGILCPVCATQSLGYSDEVGRPCPINRVAWCDTCNTGLQQASY